MLLLKLHKRTEQNIWAGAEAEGSFDGFATLLAADAAKIEVTRNYRNLLQTLLTELGKVVDAIPSALYGREDLHIYVAQNVFRAYKRSLGGFAKWRSRSKLCYMAQGNNQDVNVLFFDGVKIFMANGLAD